MHSYDSGRLIVWFLNPLKSSKPWHSKKNCHGVRLKKLDIKIRNGIIGVIFTSVYTTRGQSAFVVFLLLWLLLFLFKKRSDILNFASGLCSKIVSYWLVLWSTNNKLRTFLNFYFKLNSINDPTEAWNRFCPEARFLVVAQKVILELCTNFT